ncbi:MAG: ABC transporter permease [Pseudomonadota bacterium]
MVPADGGERAADPGAAEQPEARGHGVDHLHGARPARRQGTDAALSAGQAADHRAAAATAGRSGAHSWDRAPGHCAADLRDSAVAFDGGRRSCAAVPALRDAGSDVAARRLRPQPRGGFARSRRKRWRTFWRVTVPLALPGIVASLLLCFTISFDEFVLAFFLAGNEATLPMFIFSQLRFPNKLPGVLALGSLILLFSFLAVALSEWLRRQDVPAK